MADIHSTPGAMVRVLIQENTEHGQYNDALYYSEAEFASLTNEDIQAAIKTRVDNWVGFVKEQSSREPIPPTLEDMQQQADSIKEQLDRLINTMASSDVVSKEDIEAVAQKILESKESATTAASVKPISIKPSPIKEVPPVEEGLEP
jgi:hypothetical protein